MSVKSHWCPQCQTRHDRTQECPKPPAESSLAGPPSSASWSKAEIHFGMARAAWKLAARNQHGATIVIEQMERAIATLKAITPNVTKGQGGKKK